MQSKCPHCTKNCFYHEKYDCYFCLDCNIWTEKDCTDPTCEYCKDRPKTPGELIK